MAVSRINRKNLMQIMGGKVDQLHHVIIKFYGQNCHLCHALRDPFVEISEEFDDVYFYAFNMEDGQGLERKFGFDGVPTICYVRTGGAKPVIRFLDEPENPDKETWYKPSEIKQFINKNRK